MVVGCQYNPGTNIMNLFLGMMFIIAMCLFGVARYTFHKNKKAQNPLQ